MMSLIKGLKCIDGRTAIYVSAFLILICFNKLYMWISWTGAAFLILICFNKLYMCISWTIKRLIRTSVNYTVDIASACLFRMNGWRLALCCTSVTLPLKKRGTSPSDANLWPAAYIVTVWRHCTAKPCVCSTSWHSGCKGTANGIPQDLSIFSQQRSAFHLSSSLSSWIKQGTSSDVSNTSANFVVQPRLLRRFPGGLCRTQTNVGEWFISAQRWPTGRQADSPIPSTRRHVILSCGRVTQDRTL